MDSLSEVQVDLWLTRPEECQEASLVEEYRRLMDELETKQWTRYRVEKKRQEHLAARALVRTVLSYYAPIRPEDWRFIHLPNGKPAIDTEQLACRLGRFPSEAADLEFNLSHTEGMIFCAVARGTGVGVDVEDMTRPVEFLPLARRFFAPPEIALLEKLPPDQLPLAFYRFWTLKEAYLKAQGAGLALPLDCFCFHWPKEAHSKDSGPPGSGPGDPNANPIGSVKAPRLLALEASAGQPTHWQFREFLLEGRFQVALAVACPPETPLRLHLWETIPLRSRRPIPFPPTSSEGFAD